MPTERQRPFEAFAFIAFLLLAYIVVVRLKFVFLPLLFLGLGSITYAWHPRRALQLFLFLLPLVNSTPAFFFNGYPFNYMAVALFHLSGMALASFWKGEAPRPAFPGRRLYLIFLALLGVSVLFVYLRWSNLVLPARAFLRDTPVAPGGGRLSFACIFPALTLALAALAPLLAILARQVGLREGEALVPLRAGFGLSLLLALVQKWGAPGFMAQSWWALEMKQVNGGFSDFNAFGFFAGALFLYQACKLEERFMYPREAAAPDGGGLRKPPPWSGLLFLATTLAAVFLSGCRTAFLFVLAAALHFILSRKPGTGLKAAVGLLLVLSLMLAGGTLTRRLRGSLAQAARLHPGSGLFQAADLISSGRLAMLRDGARMTARFPLSGIGAGNFLFCLRYLRHGGTAHEDLPLNQYLLVASETGLVGLLLFVLFLAALLKAQEPGAVRLVLAAMAGALLLNNFFWFPEALLLFWLFVALGRPPEQSSLRPRPVLGALVLLAFTAMNIAAFPRLDPRAWAREASTPYDYGFSYPEREGGRTFRWSGAAAGIYVYPGKGSGGTEYVLNCGAPLAAFRGRRQVVEVYWRGKLYESVEFRDNGRRSVRIADAARREGFLEFRVKPTFNLKQLGLGEESRELGVRVFQQIEYKKNY
jgi:hypothetical protein